ncbi:hypothetical protein Y032_0004g1814 [Ancylostoma ceylanicum]|uniref:Uncharacterized protein n=1 Tax=Ancylostoma ceylanicum TaxID=53326 RepID=A0A016VTX2_9BILA|nr:hypothetical protein Y032_0004g1814 [Ancylostoma ceylanicum]
MTKLTSAIVKIPVRYRQNCDRKDDSLMTTWRTKSPHIDDSPLIRDKKWCQSKIFTVVAINFTGGDGKGTYTCLDRYQCPKVPKVRASITK